MKFECDSCHAQYMIADEKVGKRGVKVKCKKCQHVIIVRPGKHGDKAAAKDAVDKANDRAAAEDARASERDDPPASDIDDGRTELSVSAAVPPPPPPPDDSTQAGAAPDGLDALRAAVSDGAPTDDQDPFRAGEHSAFAAGGPTDPAVAALAPPPPPPEPEIRTFPLGHPEETGRPVASLGVFTAEELTALARALHDAPPLGEPPPEVAIDYLDALADDRARWEAARDAARVRGRERARPSSGG